MAWSKDCLQRLRNSPEQPYVIPIKYIECQSDFHGMIGHPFNDLRRSANTNVKLNIWKALGKCRNQIWNETFRGGFNYRHIHTSVSQFSEFIHMGSDSLRAVFTVYHKLQENLPGSG